MHQPMTDLSLFPEPIPVMSYCLPHMEAKMFKVNEFTWVVLQIDRVHPGKSKSLPCISYEHANFVFEGCVEIMKSYIN